MNDLKWDEIQASPATVEALKYGRRLTDKILIAFHHACDKRDILTAADLLGALDRLIARPQLAEVHDRRKIVETLADANYRLWDIKRQMMTNLREFAGSKVFFSEEKKQKTFTSLSRTYPSASAKK